MAKITMLSVTMKAPQIVTVTAATSVLKLKVGFLYSETWTFFYMVNANNMQGVVFFCFFSFF